MRAIREIENETIVLSDGCRLAARIWLPEDAEQNPVPGILEYLPYRKRDGTAPRDEASHPRVARQGYACVRVDMRGNGDSEGLMHDEYTAQELADGVEVIEWMTRQPWCDKSVGMIGISWGGFNGLQIAALNPPALKAIVTVCSTHDRFDRDIHYRAGCLLNDNMGWSTQMLAYSSRPPDPALVGERWRDLWLERLENMPLLAKNWLEHQRRDGYWKHGSVCEDYSAIKAAVLAVGGWADAYTDSVFKFLENLEAPCQGIIGPWLHKYPHIAWPEPKIGFLQETVRWWDRWLKGTDNGVEKLPKLRAFMVENASPSIAGAPAPGRWISEDSWPSPQVRLRKLFLTGERQLKDAPELPREMTIHSPLTVGADSGAFCPGMRPENELPGDQRIDDGLSLCFDSPPLKERVEILGSPVIEIAVSSEQPVGQICARLCDVHPDGTSYRVSWGVLSLTHRDSHENPSPMPPGQPCRIRLQLEAAAYAFEPGHAIRVALSNAYWPLVWPAPAHSPLRFLSGENALLSLPEREARNETPPAFGGAETDPTRVVDLREASHRKLVKRNPVTGETVTTYSTDEGKQRFEPHGLESESTILERFSIRPDDAGSAKFSNGWTFRVGRGPWQTETSVKTTMKANRKFFFLSAKLVAKENGKVVYEKKWKEKIPRDLM